MERDAGLDGLTEVERSIIAVMDRLTATGSERIIPTEEIRAHRLMSNVTQATFYRALKSLRIKEFIAVAPDARSKKYVLKK